MIPFPIIWCKLQDSLKKMEWVTLLITFVQNHRELWDKSSSNYKDDVMKKNAWRSIARKLKKTDKKIIR